MGYEDKVVDEGLKKKRGSQKKVRKKLGFTSKQDAEKKIKAMEPSAKTVKKLEKKIGPKLLKETRGNIAKSNRDVDIVYDEVREPVALSGEEKDPRMQAGKFRTLGSSRVPKKVDKKGNVKKAAGGTVRLASGGPVVDSYDYS